MLSLRCASILDKLTNIMIEMSFTRCHGEPAYLAVGRLKWPVKTKLLVRSYFPEQSASRRRNSKPPRRKAPHTVRGFVVSQTRWRKTLVHQPFSPTLVYPAQSR